MMDARRSQVYAGIYTFIPKDTEEKNHERSYVMRTIHEQYASSVDDVVKELNAIGKPVILLGDGVPVYHDRLEKSLMVPYTIAPLHMSRQSAGALLTLANVYAAEGKMISSDEFAPDYLRLSQAEREALNKDGGKDVKADKQEVPSVPAKIRVREMTAEDVDDAYRLESMNLGKEAWTRKQLLDAMTRDDTIYLVAELAGRIVGLCGVRNISGEGEITNVSVSGDIRRTGCGYKMLVQLIQRGHGIGIRDYTLEVRSLNTAAIGLYEKLGFKSEGVRPGFYTEPADDAVIYWKRENT
jgi:ribosomal-protein-alanine acetyltransferase